MLVLQHRQLRFFVKSCLLSRVGRFFFRQIVLVPQHRQLLFFVKLCLFSRVAWFFFVKSCEKRDNILQWTHSNIVRIIFSSNWLTNYKRNATPPRLSSKIANAFFCWSKSCSSCSKLISRNILSSNKYCKCLSLIVFFRWLKFLGTTHYCLDGFWKRSQTGRISKQMSDATCVPSKNHETPLIFCEIPHFSSFDSYVHLCSLKVRI